MFHIKGYILWQRTITLTFPVHELSALDWSEKWFLTCSSFTILKIWMKLHRYVDHLRLHIVTKDRHPYLSRLWVIHPWLIWELVFGLWFLLLYGISEWNFTDMLNIKGYIFLVRTVTLTFPVHELSALDWSENWFLTCSSFTIWSIWMKLHRYVDHQRLHIVGKDRHSYLSRLWVIHPWLIWELVFDL